MQRWLVLGHSFEIWKNRLTYDWAVLWVLICTVHLTVFSYHVMYVFQSESTLYSCLNVKELLAQNRPVWLNGWVFVYDLSGCGFESSCSHINFRFCACFEQWVPWHLGNYRVWIHSETCMWHDKNMQSDLLSFAVSQNQINLINRLKTNANLQCFQETSKPYLPSLPNLSTVNTASRKQQFHNNCKYQK